MNFLKNAKSFARFLLETLSIITAQTGRQKRFAPFHSEKQCRKTKLRWMKNQRVLYRKTSLAKFCLVLLRTHFSYVQLGLFCSPIFGLFNLMNPRHARAIALQNPFPVELCVQSMFFHLVSASICKEVHTKTINLSLLFRGRPTSKSDGFGHLSAACRVTACWRTQGQILRAWILLY